MFAAQIETRLGSGEGVSAKGPDMKVWSKMKGFEGVSCSLYLPPWPLTFLTQVDFQSVEFCYPPIIISKSSKSGYDLRYTVESSDDNIAHKGVFVVAFGIRYKSYCTNIGRTFIVDPDAVCGWLLLEKSVSLTHLSSRTKKLNTNSSYLCNLNFCPS